MGGGGGGGDLAVVAGNSYYTLYFVQELSIQICFNLYYFLTIFTHKKSIVIRIRNISL